MPSTWFSRQRGTDRFSNPVGLDLFQRLVIAAPPGSSATVSDLLDADGMPITSGTQVARHINVGLYVRKTADGGANPIVVPAPAVRPCDGDHESSGRFRKLWDEWAQTARAPKFIMLRAGNVEE